MKRLLLLLPVLLLGQDSKPAVPIAEKLRLREAQLRAERAVNALLQSPQYAAMQQANLEVQAVAAQIEKQAGCKIDPNTVECLPEPKPKTDSQK